MLIITSKEFRDHQREYFEKVDHGEQVIVQRGKNKAYALTPVTENDLYFNEKMIEKINHSLEQAKQGKVTTITNKEDLKKLLGV